jgi:HD-GYP domain-containing protein (c-di-GMP phosphodiesterase class II)
LEDEKRAQIVRDQLLRRQTTLNRVTLALGALTELPAILRTLHDETRTLLDADGFFASRYHKDSGLITALFAIDDGGELDVSAFPPIPLAPEGKGMQSQVLRTGKPLNVPDWIEGERKMQTVHHIAPDGSFTPPPPDTERDDCTKSALLVPLLFRGVPIGVLQVQSNRLNAYSREDEDLLAGLANVAAISIQNALLIAEAEHAESNLRLSLEGTLHAVSAAAETRDPYTAGHQRRTTHLAVAIARELLCSDDECDALRIAGTVHDIGKLGIPAEILSKPGVLSSIEVDLIRLHPQTAHEILAEVLFPGPVAQIVLQHHERLDGSGYPRGLAGENILREARILAVADVVEAMASHRPYRAARGLDAALGEIEQNAGRLYDSEAVEACIRLFRDKGYALPA